MGSVSPIFEGGGLIGQPEPIRAHARLPSMKPQPCVIIQFNRDGACVVSMRPLPDYFLLRALESRVERMCRVIWRMDDMMGVQFINVRTMDRTSVQALAPLPPNVTVLFEG